MLHGAIAAALTPLTGRGTVLDEDAFEPYVDFLAAGGVDGILALGTTGEGVLLDLDERKRVGELYRTATQSRLELAVHAGAQTTADTVALAEHAAEIGADAVAVIAPPYFALGEDELLAHLSAAAHACAPVPFYVYEYAARSGYAIPLAVIARLRDEVENVVGMKVSDSPWEKLEPYLLDGLDVFVGSEGLIVRALAAGAAGAVSGVAAAFPEAVVAAVHTPSAETGEVAGSLRAGFDKLPFHAALKTAAALRGVPIRAGVREPLRELHDEERADVERLVAPWRA